MDYDNDNRILVFQILGPVLCTEPSRPLIHLVFLECLSITGHQRPWCQQFNAWLIHILHHTRCKQLESLYIRACFSRKTMSSMTLYHVNNTKYTNTAIKNTKEKKSVVSVSCVPHHYANTDMLPPGPIPRKFLVFYTCSF